MYKKIFFTFFLMILISVLISQELSGILNKRYNKEILTKDINVLKNSILNMHPSVGFYQSYEWYKSYFDTAFIIKNDMTEREFRIFLRKKLLVLKCGHTDIFPSKRYIRQLKKQKMHLIPYYITYLSNKPIVVAGFSKSDSILKSKDKILAIGNDSSTKIIKEIKSLIFVDGNADIAKDEFIRKSFTFYYSSIHHVKEDSICLLIQRNTKEQNVKTPIKQYSKVINFLRQRTSDTVMKYFGNKNRAGLFLDKNKQIYFMKIKSFGGIRMKSFFRKTFKQMNKYNTETLILDLRDNPGGKLAQSSDLLSYLLPKDSKMIYQTRIKKINYKRHVRQKLAFRIVKLFLKVQSKKQGDTAYVEKIKIREKNHFNKQVYVITNAGTFSAANLTAVYLRKNRPNTIHVGTPPSAVEWGSNAVCFLKLTLPATKARFIIPTFRIYHSLDLENTGFYPMIPDIYVNYDFEDIIKRKDKEIEAIYMNMIKN